jgi:hypothetical protein
MVWGVRAVFLQQWLAGSHFSRMLLFSQCFFQINLKYYTSASVVVNYCGGKKGLENGAKYRNLAGIILRAALLNNFAET